MKINLLLNQQLIAAMNEYFQAGLMMDLNKMDALYDRNFENMRVDPTGRTILFTKADFMNRFHSMKASGESLADTDDVKFIATNVFGDYGTVMMTRTKAGKTVLYNFIWKMQDGQPQTLIREVTFEDDLADLIELVQAHL